MSCREQRWGRVISIFYFAWGPHGSFSFWWSLSPRLLSAVDKGLWFTHILHFPPVKHILTSTVVHWGPLAAGSYEVTLAEHLVMVINKTEINQIRLHVLKRQAENENALNGNYTYSHKLSISPFYALLIDRNRLLLVSIYLFVRQSWQKMMQVEDRQLLQLQVWVCVLVCAWVGVWPVSLDSSPAPDSTHTGTKCGPR